MLCLVGVIVGGPANLVVNDLREKRSWVEKRFTLTLFTGFTAFTGHSLGIHSSFALVARPRQLLALSTGVGCCLGDLNFITVDLLPGVVARQRSDDVCTRIWGRGRCWGWSGVLHEGYKPNRLKLKCVQIGFDFFFFFLCFL